MKRKEFICSLLDFMPSDTVFLLFFKCQFVRGSFYAFVRFLSPPPHSSTRLYDEIVYLRCDLLMVHLFCLRFNSIESLWFGSQWAVSRSSDQAHSHAHRTCTPVYIVGCCPSICRGYLLCFQKSFLVIGGAINEWVCTILRGKQIVISNWKWAWAHQYIIKCCRSGKKKTMNLNHTSSHIRNEMNKYKYINGYP